MSIVLFKLLHVVAISVWAAGLIALPILYRQRAGVSGEQLHSLHGFTRRFYVLIVSPAAFIAVASGIVLIFLRETYTPWFALKLGLVLLLVGLHLASGLLIVKLFKPDGRYRTWRYAGEVGATVVVSIAIVAVVLAKPSLSLWPAVQDLFLPGELERMAIGFIRAVEP